jgi:hypothetical protein
MSGVSTKGLTETMKMLEKIQGNTDEIIEDAIREGIAVVTDEMRRQISSLKTSDEYETGDKMRYPSNRDVKGLLDSLGFTPVKMDGTKFDIKSGFDGYNSNVTKKYPRGHANQMIANSINKGTSFMPAQPFINRTTKTAKAAAIDAIKKRIDKEISKINK